MRFNFEKREETFFLKQDNAGLDFSAALLSIKSSIESEVKLSVIIDMGGKDPGEDVLAFYKDIIEMLKAYKGILIVIALKEPSRYDFGDAVYLPTFHEAKEAVFMNDLENQFLNEMGDE